MAANFNVQFIINDKTQTRVIRLTDTSTGYVLTKGLFSITFPDGSTRIKTDFNNPDITSPSGYVDILAVTDLNGVLTGQYKIDFVGMDESSNTYSSSKQFDFNFETPENGIVDRSDSVIPQVQFFDSQSYSPIGSFTGTATREFKTTMPSTSAVSGQVITSSTNTLTPVISLNYYEGIYSVTNEVAVSYTHSSYSWITISFTGYYTKSFDVRQAPTQLVLVQKMNTYREYIDALKTKNDSQFEILSEKYDLLVALYTHLVARYGLGFADGSQDILTEMLSILEPYTTHTYQSSPMTPFDLALNAGTGFNVSDGNDTDFVTLGQTITFLSTSGALSYSLSNNTLTIAPTFGTSASTFAQGNDARFHDAVTLGSANGLSLINQQLSLAAATASSAGAMTASDKAKLNQVPDPSTIGSVKSVGLSMPSAFTVANSPVTSTGVLTVSAAGSASQYIKGDGTLATLNTGAVPENGSLYFTDARARGAISVSGSLSYNNVTGVISYTTPAEIDPIYTASSWYTTTNNSSNWNTAYGWGNHALAGYLLASTAASTYQPLDGDLTAIAGLTGTLGLLKKTAANTWELDTSSYLTSETDPIYTASSWYTTTNNSSNWNTAYGWGNHALAGYLTTISGITAGGELSGTYPNPTLVNSAVIGKVLTGLNVTGSTISATDSILQAFGKLQNQINGLVGSVIYQGTWNASTNTPTLASGSGTKGYYYKVSVDGTTNLDGITDWKAGDWAIYNGTAWEKVDNTDSVTSVNGFNGAVSLTTDNINEGATNKYYTDTRARASLSFVAGSGGYNSTTGVITIPTNTSQLTNGASFITLASLSGGTGITYNNTTGVISYSGTVYTDSSIRALFSAGSGISYNSTTGVIASTITQYTDAMARASLSFTAGSGAYNSSTGVITIPTNTNQLTNGAGFITGITSGMVTTALGYTPVPNTRTITINGTPQDLSADRSWTIAGTISGLTTNYIPKATSATTIGNSLIYDNGSGIGIGTTAPNGKLEIYGSGGTQVRFENTTFVGNLNIGTYDKHYIAGNGAKDLVIATNGTDRVTITSAGNFGIGTSSPAHPLSVVNPTGGFNTISMINSSSNIARLAYVQNGSTTLAYTAIEGDGRATGYLAFRTNDTERARIDSSGNLGLGVTPSASTSNFKTFEIGIPNNYYSIFGQRVAGASELFIGWNAYGGSNTTTNGSGFNYKITGDQAGLYTIAGDHRWYTAPSGTAGTAISFTQAMTLDASGRLGIGLTNPSTRLDIQETSSNTYGTINIRGNNRGGGIDMYSNTTWLAQMYADTSSNIIFATGSGFTERFRINGSSGNVSIGNTNNTYKLDVSGTIRAEGFPSFIAQSGGNPTYDLISTQTIYSAGRNWRISTNYNSWGTLEFLVSSAMGGTPDQPRLTIASTGAATFSSSVYATGFYTPGFVIPTSAKAVISNANYSGPGWNNASLVTGNGATGVIMGGDAGTYTYGWIQGVQTDNGAVKNLVLQPLGGTVGIGTTSPASFVHFQTGGAELLRMTRTSIGSYVFAISGSNRFSIYDPTADAERISITSTGNVGIGTTSPLSYQNYRYLQINGSSTTNGGVVRLGTSDNSYTNELAVDNSGGYINSSSNFLLYAGSGTPRMYINGSNGNVGIGTTSPVGKLTVANLTSATMTNGLVFTAADIAGADNGHRIGLTYGADTTVRSSIGLAFENLVTNFNSYITFGTGNANTERMRITSGGNVGIGTTSPTRKLHVNGDFVVNNGASQYYGFYVSGGEGSSPSVLIGDWYDSRGNISWDSTNKYLRIDSRYGSGGAEIIFSGNSTERMRITSGGLVGIGTTSPNYPLTIQTNSSANAISLLGRNSDNISTMGFYSNDILTQYSQLTVASGYTQFEIFNSGYFAILTSGTNRLRVTSAGEVYIAGTTDQGAYNLQVNGTGVWAAGAYVNGSDIRLKENINTITDGLSLVDKMRPVSFTYKSSYSKDQRVQTGFIAQELQEVLKDKDYLEGIVQEGPEYLNVAYQNIIPILVQSIKELKAELDKISGKV